MLSLRVFFHFDRDTIRSRLLFRNGRGDRTTTRTWSCSSPQPTEQEPVNEDPASCCCNSCRQGTHACIPTIRIIHDHQISLDKTTVFPPSFFFFFSFSVAPRSIYFTTTTGQDMDLPILEYLRKRGYLRRRLSSFY